MNPKCCHSVLTRKAGGAIQTGLPHPSPPPPTLSIAVTEYLRQLKRRKKAGSWFPGVRSRLVDYCAGACGPGSTHHGREELFTPMVSGKGEIGERGEEKVLMSPQGHTIMAQSLNPLCFCHFLVAAADLGPNTEHMRSGSGARDCSPVANHVQVCVKFNLQQHTHSRLKQ